jgi:hypothetical protein
MTPTPELALTVALVALFGVLVNAFVTAYSTRKRGSIDERLLKLKAELDQLNSKEMALVQAEHSERLKRLEFERAQDVADGERKRIADSKSLALVLEALNPQGVVAFLRDHDFGGTFDREDIAPLRKFINLSNGPEQAFLFSDLEQKRQQMAEEARVLSKLIALKTHPRQGNYNSVLPDDLVNEVRPDWVNRNAIEINDAATAFVGTFDQFVHQCRVRLGS